MNASTTIRDFLRDVYQIERQLSESTIVHHEYSVRCFERFLGREPVLTDLDETTINKWIAHMQERGLAPASVKTHRCDSLSWWNCAFDQEPPLVERAPRPRKIRVVKLGRRVPVAWRPDEILRLVETADRLRGVIGALECAKRFYWGALFRAVWDTALRRCDLGRIVYRDIQQRADGTGLLIIQQSKTGDDVIVQFSADTMQAIERLMRMSAPRELVFPLWGRKEAFYKALKDIVIQSDVRQGSYKWFRRASITARERIAPGLGQLAAGHSTPDMAKRHYIDRSQLNPAPLPPSIKAEPVKRAVPLDEPAAPVGGVIFTTTFPGGEQ